MSAVDPLPPPPAPTPDVETLDIDDMEALRMKRWWQSYRLAVIVWGALAIAVTSILYRAESLTIESGLIVLVVFAAPILAAAGRARQLATEQFWTVYSAARGLTLAKNGWLFAATPLLAKGDERRCDYVATGVIGPCSDARLGWYTYTEITHTDDGEQRHDVDFTVVAMTLPDVVARRFEGVFCRKRGLLTVGFDGLRSDRGVELESAAFNKRYELRIDDRQDQIALYELFDPTFIDALCADGQCPEWEQVRGDLVVFWKGHLDSTAELDAVCASATAIYNRYLQEHL